MIAEADSLFSSIAAIGKDVMYGIYFGTGKPEVKPMSEPTIGEIAKLLNADAKLKLYVVGYTDNVSVLGYNIKLSQAPGPWSALWSTKTPLPRNA